MSQDSKTLQVKKKKPKDSIAKLEEDLSVAVVEGNKRKYDAIIKTIACIKAIEKKPKGK
jgi:hypothetical protein